MECKETKAMGTPEAVIISEEGEGVEWMLKIIRMRSESELRRGRERDKQEEEGRKRRNVEIPNYIVNIKAAWK